MLANSAAAFLLLCGLWFSQFHLFLHLSEGSNPGVTIGHAHIKQLLCHFLESLHHILTCL